MIFLQFVNKLYFKIIVGEVATLLIKIILTNDHH